MWNMFLKPQIKIPVTKTIISEINQLINWMGFIADYILQKKRLKTLETKQWKRPKVKQDVSSCPNETRRNKRDQIYIST